MLDINKIKEQELSVICSDKHFIDIYQVYENEKNKNGYIDFDDMLSICYDTLKTNDKVLGYFRNKYEYIQLDEAQDTSTVQFAIVEMIARPKNNIFFLGDTNQSILSFRASDIQYLLNFKKKYPEGIIYYMQKNFRSTKDIVEVANEFIKYNSERYDFDMSTDKGNQRPVTIVKVRNTYDEIGYIVGILNTTLDLSQNAILFRNNLSCVALADRLVKENIPFFVKDNDNRFFSHWVIQDLLAFIDLSLDVTDYDSLGKIYYKTELYITKELFNASKILNDGKGCLPALKKVKGLSDQQKSNIDKVIYMLKLLRKSDGLGIVNIIKHDLGYEEYLKKNAEKMGYSLDNLRQIMFIFEGLIENIPNADSIKGKLEELQQAMKFASFNKGKNCVTLSTIHGSKGLEWDNVYIISMVNGVFPTAQAIKLKNDGDGSLLEEERRLCYVAMTRGRYYVDFIVPEKMAYKEASPSLFIREVSQIINGEYYEEAEDYISFKPGDKVLHNKFGEGEVISVSIDDNLLVANFNNKYGTKRLLYTICLDIMIKL